MRPDIQPGATFPDYELPDQRGRLRRLSELQGADPMILILARGHYCPKDRQQHRKLVEFWPEINVAYTRIVTISTDGPLETNEFRDGVGAPWPFLSDPERVVQRDLDIAEYTDAQHDPMTPHTLVLASSTGHSKLILPVIEDYNQINAAFMLGERPNVRADMIYFETPDDGAVFATGSIVWYGGLSHNHYDNNVSRITENVLRRFSA